MTAADRAKAAEDADRTTVDRLVRGAWFTANRPNLSWETHAHEVAAALAAARADADARWKAAVEGLAAGLVADGAMVVNPVANEQRRIAARLRGLVTDNSEEGTA